MSRRRSESRRYSRRRNLTLGVGVLVLVLVACISSTVGGGLWLVRTVFDRNSDPDQEVPNWAIDSADLTIAVSPLMAPVLQEAASRFNSLDLRTPDDKKMTVWITPLAPQAMVEAALELPNFQAISPDSSLWLDQLEQEWAALLGDN